jgi:hypothetical protein
VTDQVPHPYKTTGRIMVLYILTFTFRDSRSEDKRLWTERYQALHEFILLLISSCKQIWSVNVVPRYLNFCYIFKGPVRYLYAMLLSYLLTTWYLTYT